MVYSHEESVTHIRQKLVLFMIVWRWQHELLAVKLLCFSHGKNQKFQLLGKYTLLYSSMHQGSMSLCAATHRLFSLLNYFSRTLSTFDTNQLVIWLWALAIRDCPFRACIRKQARRAIPNLRHLLFFIYSLLVNTDFNGQKLELSKCGHILAFRYVVILFLWTHF